MKDYDMVDVSVIIVSWNAKNFLIKCIQNLLKSVKQYTMEIIVVDNSSDDGSGASVREIFPNVYLVENEKNEGFARANNIGIDIAGGRYVALVNSDIEVIDDCIKLLLSFMEKYQDIGVLGPRILNKDRTLQASCRKFPGVWNAVCEALGLNNIFPKSEHFSGEEMFYFNHEEVREVDALSGCFLMVRKEAIAQVGGLDEKFFIYSEDIDWCKRIKMAGWKIIFCPEAQAIHYGAGSSRNAPEKFLIEQKKAILQYWQKHNGIAGRITIKAILILHHTIRLVKDTALYLVYLRSDDNKKRVNADLSCLRFFFIEK